MIKICVEPLTESIKCCFDLQSFLTQCRKKPKTVYYRLQFEPFGMLYWVMFHFLTNFVPRVLGCVSSYPKTVYYKL
ncbi:hypothetical protein KSS87_003738 [Heliosperma pusillum]|nr:hypothetical protein KSS87_003738 [Heliosperma pusillum]